MKEYPSVPQRSGTAFREMPTDSFVAYPRDPTQMETIETSPKPLTTQDIESWAGFLPTVRMGGALPVTFRAEGDYVVVEVMVPYVTPESRESELKLFLDNQSGGKIALGLAEGFPIPLSARYKLPPYHADRAARFVRELVREIYLHEIDEQLRVGDCRPFAPEHR